MSWNQYQLIDLTHSLSIDTPTWNGTCGFCCEIKSDYDQIFRVQQITMQAGIGTHMDAPAHCIPNGLSVANIPLKQLIIPACVINISDRAHENYEISVEDINRYEKINGRILENSLVIGYTGWSRFWLDSERYRNEDNQGQRHFPAFSAKAADVLLERGIVGIGIDTLSPDCSDLAYPVHHRILGAGKYILENLANCDQLPPKGAFVIALPINVKEGTEAPARVVGLLPS